MARLTGGQALVHRSSKRAWTPFFGIPGIQLELGLRRALRRARSDQGRPHPSRAGDGVHGGRLRSHTGKIGVYLVVPGPGVLNTRPPSRPPTRRTQGALLTGQIQSDSIDVGVGCCTRSRTRSACCGT